MASANNTRVYFKNLSSQTTEDDLERLLVPFDPYVFHQLFHTLTVGAGVK